MVRPGGTNRRSGCAGHSRIAFGPSTGLIRPAQPALPFAIRGTFSFDARLSGLL